MKAENFTKILNADFYTGVPDSQLKALCNYLMHTYGIDPKHHVIAANEGNCTALAAGDQIVEISFEKVGVKKTMANFAPLVKITTEE